MKIEKKIYLGLEGGKMRKAFWNAWHDCHKCSSGCQNCFVYYFDKNIDYLI